MRLLNKPNSLAQRAWPLVAALALVIVSLSAASQAQAQGIFKAGARIFVPVGGTGTVDSTLVDTFAADDDQKRTEEFGDASGLGISLFGTLSAIPFLDVGLALHYLGTAQFEDDDKVAYEIGSQTDLNLRLGTKIPIIPDLSLSIFGEGGLTFVGLTDADSPEECRSGGNQSRLCRIYDLGDFKDETAPFGFNAGGGVVARYGVVPFLGLSLGLDFQYYQVQLFKGSTPDEEFTADLSGTRFRLTFGVDFDL